MHSMWRVSTQRSSEPKQPRTAKYRTPTMHVSRFSNELFFRCRCFRFFLFLHSLCYAERMQRPCIELDARAMIQQSEVHTYKLCGSRSLNSSVPKRRSENRHQFNQLKVFHFGFCFDSIFSCVSRVNAWLCVCVKPSQCSITSS